MPIPEPEKRALLISSIHDVSTGADTLLPQSPAELGSAQPHGDTPNTWSESYADAELLFPPPQPSIFSQCSPAIGTPEYKARPARLKQYLQQAQQQHPALKLTTLAEYEQQAAIIANWYRTNWELVLIAQDIFRLIKPDHLDFESMYDDPWTRAPNWFVPDIADTDPVGTRLWLDRGRNKLAQEINNEISRIREGKSLTDTRRLQTLIGLATAQKYVAQSGPKRGPGRPPATGSRAQRNLASANGPGRGGYREGSGRKNKKKVEETMQANDELQYTMINDLYDDDLE